MIRVETAGKLWVIEIDRPGKANSLTSGMLSDLVDGFAAAENGGAQAVILTGKGKVFSAGADLDEVHAGLAISPLWEELSQRIAGVPALTIAALNGTLAGGATGMALACDLRLAVPEAKFFYPVMKLGFLPQPSDPPRLRALIGSARTRMILLAGQKIATEEALSWGLIDRIVPAEALLETAKALAADALAASAGHVRAIKSMIGQA